MVNTDGLHISDAQVRYGAATAVDGVSLTVPAGEIVAVIGPSGCGKSSLLRAVAGLEPLAGGRISWDGRDLSGTEPHRRNFGLMFQQHALFGHRDVAGNVEFGLRMQGLDAGSRRRRVGETLELVGLSGFESRQVASLSGGEAQRVALARALAPRPRLLMLDEPLGSLDRSLRERLALDIRASVRELGIAALHVTHDQDEAFVVADRVAVLRTGRLLAYGSPVQLWRDPGHEFVARFLGLGEIIGADEAGALGIGPPATGAAIVLLAGALQVHDGGRMEAHLIDVRLTSTAVHASVRVEGMNLPVTVHATHGSTDAVRLSATPPGAPIRMELRTEYLATVSCDR